MGQQNSRQLFRPDTLSSDPTAFRVFVKKRNKFIPGWLKINDDEIIFARSQQNYQCWPLAYLRRYGYTCSGVFFFESGRRCATGEGLHTFQSHQAERIFQVVQSKIKIEEYARGQMGPQQHGSRASSVASNRIHPVQRFSSEGAGNNAFGQQLYNHAHHTGEQHHSHANAIYQAPGGLPAAMTMSHHGVFSGAEPPSSVRQRLPSAGSAHSMAVGEMAASGRWLGSHNERPRSVVSAVEHGVYAVHPPPHPYHHGPPHSHYLPPSASSSMVGSVHSAFQPPVSNNASGYLPLSVSGSGLMNRSFMSTMTASTTASTPTPHLLGGGNGNSPWTSQQQLIDQSNIVQQHTIASSGRRYAPSRKQPIPAPTNPSVAMPFNQFQPIRATSAFSNFQQHSSRFNDHHYVNVDLLAAGSGGSRWVPPRELHRTTRTGAVGSTLFNNNAAASHSSQLAPAMARAQPAMDPAASSGSKIPLPSAGPSTAFSAGRAPLVNYALLDLEKTSSASGSMAATPTAGSSSRIPQLSLAGAKGGAGPAPLRMERSPGGGSGRSAVGADGGQTPATMGAMMVKKD